MDQRIRPTFRLAPAKVNLALHVTGRRDDGYHLLQSLVGFCSFGDLLAVEPSEEDELIVTGPFAAHVPISDDNLVIAARDRLRAFLGSRDTPAVRIRLEKNLPVASGVGGGSSDAATALKELTALWAPDVPASRLHEIALALGADVPMCLEGRALRAEGVGERLVPVGPLPPLPMILVNPGPAVSTAHVFGALERRDNPPLPDLPDSLPLPGLLARLEETRNDLQQAAAGLAPDITAVLAELGEAGARFARMSGSGATCFGIFPSLLLAEEAARGLSRRRPEWFVKATVAQ
ncbi:MAG: 4-(cytidine 5'-diphospho)-2-C-methyl-D-erythritol kinase [Rhizobiales bacterium]|nr:4-(cytidine 5'-diphospho)-2-C-methyl-D-erythritol kinase [Hyphomicrobiales bacterium]